MAFKHVASYQRYAYGTFHGSSHLHPRTNSLFDARMFVQAAS
jgi:hypothetical protein